MKRVWLFAFLALALAAPARADWHASGQFFYHDREQNLTGFTGVEPDKPARRVDVQVLDANTSAVLATGATALDGSYNVLVTDASTRNVRVRMLTSSTATAGLFESVRVSSSNPALYSVTSSTVNSHSPTTDVNFGGLTAMPGAGGEAFNIFDVLLNGLDYLSVLNGSWPASAVVAYWNSSSTDGTFFQGSDNSIHLLAAVGYDDAVIGHEEGHFAAKTYSKDNSPGGQHFLGDNNQDLRLAFSEGWATYFSCSVRRRLGITTPGITYYVTTTGAPGVGNLDFSYELETPSIGCVGAASEVTVQAALWDIVDSPATADDSPGVDDDPIADRTDEDVWEVMHNYLPQASVTNVCLEDFWDGWFRPGFSHGDQAQMIATFEALGVEYYSDAFETDNTIAQAVPIAANGLPQHRTFYPAGDTDFSWFVGQSGQTYTVETTDLVSDANTTLSVLDSLGNVLATNDDRSASDPSSRILFTPGSTGRYFARVMHAPDIGVYGSYNLRVFSAAPPSVTFTDVTTASGAGSSASSRGVVWGDYDNDGWPDLFLCNVGSADQLFHNQQNGTFQDRASTAGVNLSASTEGACWGDYDNDGDLDLYVVTAGNGNVLYKNQLVESGTATFTNVTAAAGVTSTASGRTANWVDYNNDGWLDLFVANISGGPCQLFRNNGNGTFTDVAAAVGLAVTGVITSAWCDYDNDGDMDVFLGVNGGPSHLFRNDGGTFTDVTGTAGTVGGTATWAAEWGDFDNDGWPDLFVADNDGANFLYHNNGNGVFTNVAGDKGVASILESTSANFADYDLDGDLDLYVSNYNSANLLYNNLTGSAFTVVGDAGLVARTRAAAWADYDRDGDPDLYVSTEAANVFYRNDAPARPWLAVDLTGRASNRNGIGAKITVSANGRRQIRQVSAGFGFGCQEPLRTLFGLGTGAAIVDTVVVDWPSHKRSTLTGVTIDQTLLVDEASAVDAGPAPVPAHLALAAPWPSPARSAVSFDVSVPSAEPVALEILSASGRVVARVQNGLLGAGMHRLQWNLRDGGGARVGAGVYFASLRAGAESRQEKVVVLPE
jgi:hypothetical protein